MDLSTTLSLVQTILTAIQSLGLMQSLFSISHCRSELDDLHKTVQTVRAVLEDADAKQDLLNSQEKNYIQELKDAVYDADDVLDEFLTLAKRQKLREDSDKFSDKKFATPCEKSQEFHLSCKINLHRHKSMDNHGFMAFSPFNVGLLDAHSWVTLTLQHHVDKVSVWIRLYCMKFSIVWSKEVSMFVLYGTRDMAAN
ncbi:uncharacterized protein LOC141610965 isoform X1 [Silene latifolia]|uniref:uncharacterized protein LOC141610965 isoform X1 n=1 Tax=Silene latifolia TaxID=37657 RepID=UPI003D77E3C6